MICYLVIDCCIDYRIVIECYGSDCCCIVIGYCSGCGIVMGCYCADCYLGICYCND